MSPPWSEAISIKTQRVSCWLALSVLQIDVVRFSHPFVIDDVPQAGFPFQTIPYSTVNQSYNSPQENRRRECRKGGVGRGEFQG